MERMEARFLPPIFPCLVGFEYRQTEIIVASVRSPLHIVESAMVGADIATVPFKVIEQLFKHPLTDNGITKFLSDWNKLDSKIV